MTEWWTYQPSDFLMFSPRIYWRLFESMNHAWWPAQPLLLAAAAGWLGLQARRRAGAGGAAARAAAAGLALCWAIVAWDFLLQRFAPIHPAAGVYAAAFFVQAGLLGALAGVGGVGAARGARRAAGLLLGAAAVLGHPALALAFGRDWPQAEVFGLAPDPTAIGTLAFLLLARARGRPARWLLGALWLVPLAWCLASGATLLTMGSAQGGWLIGAGALAALAALAQRGKADAAALR